MAEDKAVKSESDKTVGETHLMTNPNTGESRMVSQADWDKNSEEYIVSGFIKPDAIKDSK